MTKIVQTLTLKDEATPALEDIGQAAVQAAAELDKTTIALGKTAKGEAAVGKAGKKAAEGFRSASEGSVIFTKQLDRNTRAYKRLLHRYDETARVTDRVAKATKIFNAELKEGRITAAQYAKQLAMVTKGIENQGYATSRGAASQLSFQKVLERTLFVLKTYIAVLATRAMYEFVTGIVEARLAIEKMDATLMASTGSLAATNEALEFIKQTSGELGLVFKDTAIQYSKFMASTRGSALAEQSQDIFKGFSTAAVALRLSAAETEGVFRALTQMISKGNVQAEELRGQLGERLPGALKLAADSLGVTTGTLNDMLEQGEVLAEDLLPRMAQQLETIYGSEAQKAAESMQGRINGMKNAWFDFQAQVSQGTLGDLAGEGADLIAYLVTGATEGMAIASDVIDMFQAKVLGVIPAFEKLNKVPLGVLIAELGRADTELADLQRQQAATNDIFEQATIAEAIADWMEYQLALTTAARAQSDITVAIEDTDLALRKASNALTAQINKYDPLYDATVKYEKELAVVNAAIREGAASEEVLLAELVKVTERYQIAKDKAMGLGDANRKQAAEARKEAAALKAAEREQQKKIRADEAAQKAIEREAQALETLLNSLDPARAAASLLFDQTEQLNTAFDEGSLSATDYYAAIAQSKEKFDAAMVKAEGDEAKNPLEGWQKTLDDIANKDTMSIIAEQAVNSINSLATSLVDLAITGEGSMGDLAKSLVRAIAIELVAKSISEVALAAVSAARYDPAGVALHLEAAAQTGAAAAAVTALAASFKMGGVAGQDERNVRAVPASAFFGANEVPAVLHRGEEVITPSDPRHIKNHGSRNGEVALNVDIEVINNGTPVDATVVTRENQNGDRMVQVILNEVAQDIVKNGVVGRSIDRSRGTKQQGAFR